MWSHPKMSSQALAGSGRNSGIPSLWIHTQQCTPNTRIQFHSQFRFQVGKDTRSHRILSKETATSGDGWTEPMPLGQSQPQRFPLPCTSVLPAGEWLCWSRQRRGRGDCYTPQHPGEDPIRFYLVFRLHLSSSFLYNQSTNLFLVCISCVYFLLFWKYFTFHLLLLHHEFSATEWFIN